MPILGGVITGGAMLLATAAQMVVPTWAVSGVAVLLGIAAGLVVAELIRDQQARREHAAAAAFAALPNYLAVTNAALDLAALPVWSMARDIAGDSAGENSESHDPDQLARQAADAVRALAFRPAAVCQAADEVVTAARELAGVVNEIRATSKPGHAGAIDARVADRHTAAVVALRDAHDRFVTVCRADLGVEHAQLRPRLGFTRS
jgi:hypothetical protein